jgi:hypothetical protein
MTLDPVANLITLNVSGTYGTSDTTITLASGGSSLPSPSFNLVWWNSSQYQYPNLDPNVEIVRVTGVSGNTLTVTRAQEGTSATAKSAGTVMMLTITAKMITDIGANLQQSWKLVNVVGTIDGTNTTFTLQGSITPFDPNSMQLSLARQPQLQGIDYTISGTTISYITPPPASLAGNPHIAQYQ